MNFIKIVEESTAITDAQKLIALNEFCDSQGFQHTELDKNSLEAKKGFFNLKLTEFVKNSIRIHKIVQAQADQEIQVADIEL